VTEVRSFPRYERREQTKRLASVLDSLLDT